MKKLLFALLITFLPSTQADEIIDMVTVNGAGDPVEFVNGFNLDKCLEYDRFHKSVEKISEAECSGRKKYYAKQAAAEAQARLQDEENRRVVEELELKQHQEISQKEKEQAQRDQAYQKDQERIAQLKMCEATQAYRLYEAQEVVIEDVEVQQNLKKAVARQKQLIKMSGVRNLSEERQIAVEQLEVQAALKDHWAEYKSVGGKAATPKAVKHSIKDPCDSFRPEES